MKKRFLTPFAFVVASFAMGHADADLLNSPQDTAKQVETGFVQQERGSNFDFVIKNSEQGITGASFSYHRSHSSHSSHRSHYSSRR